MRRLEPSKWMREAGNQTGQALVEYALVLFFIVLVCVTALAAIGGKTSELLSGILSGF